MKLLKILHYVESSFDDLPSFVLLMSDNKEYISISCEFVENNEDNIKYLIDEYYCKEHLEELFASDSREMSEITDADYMFYSSNITEFNSDMSNVKYASGMFGYSKLAEFNSDMPNVKYASYMFNNSKLAEFNSAMPNVKYASYMFFNTPYGRSVNNA